MSASRRSTNPVKKNLQVAITSALFAASLTASADQTYGPIQSKDTLGKIVSRFYVGPNKSRLNLMKEIVANNPKAFGNGNMNLLKLNALLILPGDEWLVNESRFVSPNQSVSVKASLVQNTHVSAENLSSRTPQQMQDRIVFFEAERISLIAQVATLKQETVRLEAKLSKLALDSRTSDEQLLILDKEIIRLTQLLSNRKVSAVSGDDLSQLSALQEKLLAVQQETEQLRSELSQAKTALSNNNFLQQQADQNIASLTQENAQLQHLLQSSQPGVHYFGESSDSGKLSLLGGKLNFPVWMIIMGGALLSLVMITLLATRKRSEDSDLPESSSVMEKDLAEHYDSLLEASDEGMERGFAQASTRPEENVFKMFDEGSLEMDLKLDMAEAYLQVADYQSARSVLQEVIEGGSELQQRKATRLMQQAA